MSDFNSSIIQLGGKAFTYYSVAKKTNTLLLKGYIFGVFLDNIARTFDNRKDLIAEGWSNTLYSQTRLDNSSNNYYLEFEGTKFLMSLQSNHYQKPLGQTLNHYAYSLRRVTDDFEIITN